MSTHKEQTLEPTPSLQSILDEYGNLDLFEYASRKYQGLISDECVFLERKWEFIRFLGNYITETFWSELARITTDSLNKNYCISTGDHHGPMGHPFFFHSATLRGLVHPHDAIINLSTSHVSLGNSSYPRGIIFHWDWIAAPEKYLHLPFFGSQDRMLPLYGLAAYSEYNINRYTRPQLAKYKQDKKITEKQAHDIEHFIDEVLLTEKLLSRKTYSEQCTILNFYWWAEIFKEDLPPFIGLDSEVIVRHILLKQIQEQSIFTDIFFSPGQQKEIETLFNGIGCCFNLDSHRWTYLFWYIDNTGKRQSLWRDGEDLRTDNGAFNIKIDRESIAEYLKNGTLIPSGLLVYTLLVCYYKLTCFGGIFQAEYLTQIQRQYQKLSLLVSDTSLQTSTDIINADLYHLYSNPTTPITAMDYHVHPEYLPITQEAPKNITLKTALENSLADICGVNFHLLYPSGNLTALVEVKTANKAFKEKTERLIYQKFPEVEQVGFIYTENGEYILEMAGNEMCVNATLCYFHLCFLREKEIKKIFIKWPNCYLEWLRNDDDSICLLFPEIHDKNIEHNLSNNTHVVRLPGIVHIFTEDPTHDKALLAAPHLSSHNALGVSFVDTNKPITSLKTHIFLSHIGTFREETSCGSWAIAYGALVTKKHGSISEQITQLSGKNSYIAATTKNDWYIQLKLSNQVEYRGVHVI